MPFLDTTGLQRVWGKITSLFVPKNAALTEEEITTATTQGGSSGGDSSGDSLETRVSNLLSSGNISSIKTEELTITSSSSLILGGSSYSGSTSENSRFSIKCPARPYFDINGVSYNLPWKSTGSDVTLSTENDIVEKFRIVPQHFGGDYYSGISLYSDNQEKVPISYDSILDYSDEDVLSSIGTEYFMPVKKNIKIENYSPSLLDSNRFRVFFMRWRRSGRCSSTYSGASRWRVKYFYSGGPSFPNAFRNENKEWWKITGPVVWFFGSESRSILDYFSLFDTPDVHSITGNGRIGCAIFEYIPDRDRWIRVSNIAGFNVRRYIRSVDNYSVLFTNISNIL